jgi:Helicase HerA, central domain
MAQPQKAPRLLPTQHTAQRMATLGPNFEVDVDTLLAHRMVGFGLPGSGKTNLVALLAEQIGQYSIPEVIFDWEGDFLSLVEVLPRGIVATAANCPTGKDILKHGLQVIFDLASWGSTDEAANAMVNITHQLVAYADSIPPQDRVPCPIFLDEAHKWLPQDRQSWLTTDMYKAVYEAFSDLGSRGRKRGLVPALFAQRISLLNKDVMFPGVYFLMQQTMHTDLAMYMQYVQCGDLTVKQVKSRISSFGRGKAIVKLPDSQRIVTFNHRRSEHTSHTPTSQAAINKYAAMPFDRSMRFGSFLPAEEMAQEAAAPAPVKTVKAKKPATRRKGRPDIGRKVRAFLKSNPDATLQQLADHAGCSTRTAWSYKQKITG